MKVNRKSMVLGFAGLGLASALATGIGIAQAAPGGSPSTAPSASAWGFGGMHGHGAGSCLTAAAKYLGLSDADLHSQLLAGKTLAQVATEKGKSVDGIKEAMLAAAKSNLNADTTLTAEQKAARLEQLKTRFDVMINQVHAPGTAAGVDRGHMSGGHMGGGHMDGWMRGAGR